jgi:phosphoribosylanthranilate isomerase
MKIKVCGLKYPGNVAAVAALQPDYAGFVFYGPSPRYVGELQTDTIANISPAIKKTAVFVNETADKINALIAEHHFDAVQLHGAEDAAFCRLLRKKTTVIKAFGMSDTFDFSVLESYAGSADFFLFDTKTVIHGGSGNSFNWTLLNNYRLEVPFFLSGGISLDNLDEIKNITHPQFYGVDLNSRFEKSPGLKDIARLEKAFEMIKHTANELRS